MQLGKHNQDGGPGVQFLQYLRKSNIVIQLEIWHEEG